MPPLTARNRGVVQIEKRIHSASEKARSPEMDIASHLTGLTGGPGPPARRRFVVGLRPDACTVTDTSCRAAWRGERNEEQHSIARSNFQCAETDASRAAAGGAAWSSGDANYWGLRRKCGDDDGRLRWAPRAAYLLVALAKVSPGQQSRFFFFTGSYQKDLQQTRE